jgi:hypothetical protein
VRDLPVGARPESGMIGAALDIARLRRTPRSRSIGP